MNCKHPTEKRLGASVSEIVDNTLRGSEKTVSPVCRIKTKVWATDASGAMNLKNYKKWLNAIEPEPKRTRASPSNVAVVLRSVLNISQKVTSTTRWAFKVKKYDRSFKARQVVLGWKHKHGSIDCGITFVFRFDLLVTVLRLQRESIFQMFKLSS